MNARQGRLTYANLTATLALLIAIGGTSAFAATQLAKNSVGTGQLRKNAVTSSRIENGAVTGSKVANGALTGTQIDASTLGTVPLAANSQQLDGSPAAAFMDKCPSGTTRAAADLCVMTSDARFAPANFTDAMADCAVAGMRLPRRGAPVGFNYDQRSELLDR